MFAFLSANILLVAVSWRFAFRVRLAVDADHFLFVQEVIGALRVAAFKEDSPGEQGRSRRTLDAMLKEGSL